MSPALGGYVSRRLKIFISSPGDVIPERQIARKVIGELNEEMMGKVFLVPVLWENEPLLASGTFQTQIDPPEEVQILLGILWSRIGSPLPDTILRPDGTRYDSGTAFEFESALASHQKRGKPDILLYRKLGAPSVSLDNREEFMERLEQMDMLDAYIKKQLMAEDGSYLAAFHTFETEEQFENILKTHLRKLILRQLEESENKEGAERNLAKENTTEAPVLPDTLSFGVLPFDNMSKDPEQEFFVDGLTEDIITELSRFKDLDVIARNSTFQYKGKSVDVRQVGQELGARYVLEGSVRKAGNVLRVTAQLLDATDGSHLWAETYDRDFSKTNFFEVQDQISNKISSIIGDLWGVLKQVQFEKLKQENLENLTSEQSVQYAQASVQRTGYHLDALAALKQSTIKDPNNGNVWALLSHAYSDEYSSGNITTTEPLDRALHAGQKAVELDPSSDRTRSALARAHFQNGEFEEAIAEQERALKINPKSETRLWQHGYYLSLSGNWESGLMQLHKALEINDSILFIYWTPLFLDHYLHERYEDAVKVARKYGMIRVWFTQAYLAAAYGQLKNFEKANSALDQLLLLRPGFHRDARGYIQRCQGSSEGMDKLLDGLRKAGLDIPNE